MNFADINQTLRNEVTEKFDSIARMHRKDLRDTFRYRNWNTFCSQLSLAKAKLSAFAKNPQRVTPKDEKQLIRALEGLIRGWNEVHAELLMMVDAPNHEEVERTYKAVHGLLSNLFNQGGTPENRLAP